MNIKFKYNVGDTVTLIKEPPMQTPNKELHICSHYCYEYNQSTRDFSMQNFHSKEYKIKKCCWYIESVDMIPHPCYWLDAYCDGNIDYHNMIPEEYLEGTLNEHIEEYNITDSLNNPIKIHDTVYSYIINNQYKDKEPELWSINGWGKEEIVAIYLHESNHIQYRTSFLYPDNYINGQRRNTNRHYGFRNSHSKTLIIKEIPNNFVDMIATYCHKRKIKPLEHLDCYYSEQSDLKMWLTEFNLYDDFIEKYNNYKQTTKKTKKQSKKNIKPNNNNKINNIIATLSEKEKQELLKQLTS